MLCTETNDTATKRTRVKPLRLPALAGALAMAASAWGAPVAEVTIAATRPGALINKHLYGQLAEHGSGGNAGGLWVGPDSGIAHVKGWRKDGVDALKALRVPLLRWPGGCSGDEYNWRDGIGAPEKRPARIDRHQGGAVNVNAIGTHEFFDLAESIGADAYLTGNVGTGSAREAAEWVEYMVADAGSTLAKLRADNGRAQPFKVTYFSVGHAPWGCGGNMSAQYYGDLYNQYAVFLKGKGDNAPVLVASGRDADWTDELSTVKRIRDYRAGISVHPPAADDEFIGSKAQGRAEARWIATLRRAFRLNEFIASNLARLDKNDPKRKTSLVIGEWGTAGGSAAAPRSANQPNALGDALAAALHFHAFHAHAGRLSAANIAPASNAGATMIVTEGDKLALTPTYHAFRMHVPFQDAASLPVKLANNPRYASDGIAIPALSASAARGKDGKLYLSLVNTHPRDAIAVSVAGAAAKGASGSVLTAKSMDAHNSVASPQVVQPAPFQAQASQGKLRLTLAPKSVTVLAIDESR